MGHASQIKAAVILLILHTTTSSPAKNTAPSVHETINEQARIDDKRPLPYGNPLAGNSLQNAKLHAQHQQAMFNAERVRQHRAQIQRWNKAPLSVDSYMKAYRESQENHHLALEQMQGNPKEKKIRTRPERPNLKSRPQLEPVKITRADAVDKNRNHRSYGSVHYVQKKRKINTSPGTTYDQGVTIKPNGNIGLNNLEKEQEGLYTSIIPSKTQYVYPKLYNQMHSYQSADDIHTLNTLLAKQPQEQLSQFNTLISTNKEREKNTLETPIDLFFYLNDPNVASGKYTIQNTYNGPYTTEFANYEDFKPITEEVDDVEDERKDMRAYPSPITPSPMPPVYEDPTTTKSNYYKIEVEQTISGNKPKNEFTSQEKPAYSALTYEKPLSYYPHEPSAEGVKYLHAQHSGVQHLAQDGTGVSAYGSDDVSIKKRTKRQLDTELFLLGNETLPIENVKQFNPQNRTLGDTEFEIGLQFNITDKSFDLYSNTSQIATDRNETLPQPEQWKRYRTVYDNQALGEARDYDYYEEDDNDKDYSYDTDYDPEDELSPPDFDYEAPNNYKQPAPFRTRANRQRNQYSIPNIDIIDTSFSNRYANFKHPNYNDFHSSSGYDYSPNTNYGPPSQYGPPNTDYGPPSQQYGPPKSNVKGNKVSSILDSLEPVYMLTESQLKNIVGQGNVNVQHLDVFQYPPITKQRKRYPRKIKKNRRRPRNFGKFRKLKKIVHH